VRKELVLGGEKGEEGSEAKGRKGWRKKTNAGKQPWNAVCPAIKPDSTSTPRNRRRNSSDARTRS